MARPLGKPGRRRRLLPGAGNPTFPGEGKPGPAGVPSAVGLPTPGPRRGPRTRIPPAWPRGGTATRRGRN